MMAEIEYFKPNTVSEALKIAETSKHPFRFLAGGTDLFVNRFQGNDKSENLIDLTFIEELKKIEIVEDRFHPFNSPNSQKNKNSNTKEAKITGERILTYLKIGALVSLEEVTRHPTVRNEFPALENSCRSVGTPVIRKTATLAGNILCENRCIFFNQSDWWRTAAGHCLKCEGDICIATGGKKACFSKFVSDSAVALISMNALIEIASSSEKRVEKLENIFSGNGVKPRLIKNNELILSVLLPMGENFRASFKKLRLRESLDFASLSTCVSLNKRGEIKIVLGSVDPAPVVVSGKINAVTKELVKECVKKARIVENDVFSRKYRKEMIPVFLNKSFTEIFSNWKT